MQPVTGSTKFCSRVALIASVNFVWALPCAAVYQSLRSTVHSANGSLPGKPYELKAGRAPGQRLLVPPGAGAHALAAHASNHTGAKVHFNPLDYASAIGKVFVFYYSSASGELATSVEARGYRDLPQAPSALDPVYDPSSGGMVRRGACPLRLISQTSYPSDQRKANLRLAEIAVCEVFYGNPCKGGAVGCELEVLAPLPYSDDQEPYVGAGMALVAHSLLCSLRADAGQSAACAVRRSRAAVSAGLRFAQGAVELQPLPSPWVDMKLDACYALGFREAVFAAANREHYLSGEHYSTKHDVLAWSTTPPEAVFCEDLPCLVQKFER